VLRKGLSAARHGLPSCFAKTVTNVSKSPEELVQRYALSCLARVIVPKKMLKTHSLQIFKYSNSKISNIGIFAMKAIFVIIIIYYNILLL